MKQIIKNLIALERVIEDVCKDCDKMYKPFYEGYLKGLRESRAIVIKEIFNLK